MEETLRTLKFMHQRGKLVSTDLLKYLLQWCTDNEDLAAGRQAHSFIISSGGDSLDVSGSYLIRMFASRGSLLEANLVFLQIPNPCVYAWHAIIAAHTVLYGTEKAIELCRSMQQAGLVLANPIVLCVLKACTKQGVLTHGRLMNDQIIKSGQSSDVAVASTLVDMYAKCGSLAEAQKVFDNLPIRNVVTWNALISGYATSKQSTTALLLFEKMKQESINPAKVTFLCVLKACSSLAAVGQGNLMYDDIIRSGLELDVVVGNTLVDLYARCGCLQEAWKVFETLPVRDVVSWNAMISGHAQCGHGATALGLFNKMQAEGVKPDIVTFSCAFKACSSIEAGNQGKLIHKKLIRSGLEIDAVVGSTLVDMYAKCGNLEEARHAFDGLPNRNSVLWGTMIAGYTQHGQYILGLELFKRMQLEDVKPDTATFTYILKSCASLGALSQGRVVHNQVLVRQWEAESAIGNALIDMYAKCGSLKEAQQVLNELPDQNVVSWNSLIAGYVQHEDGFGALELFERMQQEGIRPDKVTILGALKACASVGAISQGKKLHEQVFRCGLESDVVLGSTLVDMYAKWGNLEEAHAVLNRLPYQDVVSCGAMIAGYIQHGHCVPAFKIYELMQWKSITPDNVTFACILKACSTIEAIDDGKHIHDEVIRNDFGKDVLIGNALIDMYARCGRLLEARYVFDALPSRNLASWNSIMTGYAQHEDGFPALELFELMHQEGVDPNKVSFLCTFKACSSMGSIDHGMLIHEQVIRSGLESDLVVGNSIVDMYAKCGNLQEAHKVFDGLPNQDVVSWSALIAGYAQHGSFRLVQQHLHDMQQEGLKPVNKTFTSILVACSHAGQVEEGRRYFKSMREDYGITPSIEHCNCMIDILGRAGRLDDARKFLQSMPVVPNITTWMSLLTSCRTFGSIDLAKVCFDQVVERSPNNSAAFMLMSKIYADANMWVDVHKLEDTRRYNSAFKKPGKVCPEVADKVNEFIAGEKTPQCFESVSFKPKVSTRALKERGYVPQSDSVLELESGAGQEEDFLEACQDMGVYHVRKGGMVT